MAFASKSNQISLERWSACFFTLLRSGLGTSTSSAEPVAALDPGGATAALPEFPLRILCLLCYDIICE
nr:MAG TPA: hypothetical protein [Caudoviricetes sp.]